MRVHLLEMRFCKIIDRPQLKLLPTLSIIVILVFCTRNTFAFQTITKDSLQFFQQQAKDLQTKRKYLKANVYLNKLLNIYEKQGNHPEFNKCYRQLLVNLVNTQSFELFQERALFFIKKLKGTKADEDFLASTFSLIGYSSQIQGNYQKAIKFKKKAIKIWGKNNKQANLASSYLSLSNYYGEIGANEKSLTYANKSLSILENLKDTVKIANAYNNISLLLNDQKKYTSALKYAYKSLKLKKLIYPPNYFSIDNANQVIGLIYIQLKKYAEALNFFKLSLNYRISKYTANHYLVASTYLNIANVYKKEGKLDSVSKYYNLALSIRKTYQQTTNLVYIYNLIANTNQKSRNYTVALQNYQKAIYYNSKTPLDTINFEHNPKEYINARLYLESLQGKAAVLQSIGDAKSLNIALQTYQLCDEVIQKLRQQYVNYQDKLTLANLSAEIYEQAVMACYQMIQKQPTQEVKYTTLAFRFSERNKASILREALQEANAKFDLPKNLVEQERDLKINLAYYEKQLASAQKRKDSTKVVRFQNKLFDLNREREQMTQMLEKRYPRYYQLKYNTQLADMAAIKKRLPNQALLVAYFTTQQKSFAFVVSKTQCKMVALPYHKKSFASTDATSKPVSPSLILLQHRTRPTSNWFNHWKPTSKAKPSSL